MADEVLLPPRGPERKEESLTIGAYPEISLKEARDERDSARRDLRSGIDPMVNEITGQDELAA